MNAIRKHAGFGKGFDLSCYAEKYATVCSAHFDSESFQKWGAHLRLKSEAVPTVFSVTAKSSK